MPTIEDLRVYQSLNLDLKIALTQDRIRQWLEVYGSGGAYISFSGGKDSTVLLHLVRDIAPDVPAVFVNTGLEYPEIQQFARSFDNVLVLTPKKRFKDVITQYGYPFIGKEAANRIDYARRCIDSHGETYIRDYVRLTGKYPSTRIEQLYSTKQFSPRYDFTKYRPLIDIDFRISAECCGVMKKKPVKDYHRKTGRNPFVATTAAESQLRTQQWLKNGCNAFNTKIPTSTPLSFWTDQDILQFIKTNGIKLASVYGDIVQADPDGLVYDQILGGSCPYKTTGCSRTGCIFCGFGAHLEKGEGRFVRLKRTHPKQYNYCLDGGAYDSTDGLWKPNAKGLGMAHCIDVLNSIYGKDFIKY